jgi:hypothetical protein
MLRVRQRQQSQVDGRTLFVLRSYEGLFLHYSGLSSLLVEISGRLTTFIEFLPAGRIEIGLLCRVVGTEEEGSFVVVAHRFAIARLP